MSDKELRRRCRDSNFEFTDYQWPEYDENGNLKSSTVEFDEFGSVPALCLLLYCSCLLCFLARPHRHQHQHHTSHCVLHVLRLGLYYPLLLTAVLIPLTLGSAITGGRLIKPVTLSTRASVRANSLERPARAEDECSIQAQAQAEPLQALKGHHGETRVEGEGSEAQNDSVAAQKEQKMFLRRRSFSVNTGALS